MPDFEAIGTAIALRFAAANVTPPAGYGNVRLSTSRPPNQLGPLPCVVVFPEGGDFTALPGKRDSTHRWLVRFYYDQAAPGDLERSSVGILEWLTVLSDQLRVAAMLGGIVTSARVTGWTIGGMTYAGESYVGIELVVEVVVNEAWSAVA